MEPISTIAPSTSTSGEQPIASQNFLSSPTPSTLKVSSQPWLVPSAPPALWGTDHVYARLRTGHKQPHWNKQQQLLDDERISPETGLAWCDCLPPHTPLRLLAFSLTDRSLAGAKSAGESPSPMQRSDEGLAETPRAVVGREHLRTAKSSPPLPRPPKAVLVGLRARKMEAGRGKGASHGMVTRSRTANPTSSIIQGASRKHPPRGAF